MLPNELSLEPATRTDVDALVELRDRLARWLTEAGIRQWTAGEFPAERMRALVDTGSVFLDRGPDGAPVTAVAVEWADPAIWGDADEEAGYVHLLMVDRRLGGRGVGAAVLAWAEKHIAATGRRLARLDAVTSNRRLRRWYEERGYVEVGRRSFDDPRWFPTTLMQKRLDPVRMGFSA